MEENFENASGTDVSAIIRYAQQYATEHMKPGENTVLVMYLFGDDDVAIQVQAKVTRKITEETMAPYAAMSPEELAAHAEQVAEYQARLTAYLEAPSHETLAALNLATGQFNRAKPADPHAFDVV